MFLKSFRPIICYEAPKDNGGGGAHGADPDGGGKKPEKEPPTEPKDERKFTQADADQIAGKARDAGRQAAINDLLKELGLEKADDLKTLVADTRKKQDAEKSELQKALDRIEELSKATKAAEAKREEALGKATERLMKAAVLTEAAKPDYRLRTDALPDVWTFIDRAALKVKEDGETFEGIAEAVKAVIKAKPYLVDSKPKGPGSPPAPDGAGRREKEPSDEDRARAQRQTRNSF